MYKKGTGNDKQGKDAGNRTLCPYRNFSQAIMDHRIFPALQNYEKPMKEAARIICYTIYWITQTYFFLQERLLWMKAFSAIFGRSEAARLYTVSSIG